MPALCPMLAGAYLRGIVIARVSVFVRPNSFVNSTVRVAVPGRAPGRMVTANVRRRIVVGIARLNVRRRIVVGIVR